MTDRNEHRIVAEAVVAPRRPDENSVHPAVERFGLAVVRPGNRQRAGEVRRRSAIGSTASTSRQTLLHRSHPVAVPVGIFRPARRENAGPAVECIDAQAAIVRERRQAGEVRRFARLQIGIVGEAVANLFRLRKPERFGADAFDAERLHERRHLALLAGVVGRNDQLVADRPHRPTAFSCAWKISRTADPREAEQSQQSFLVVTFALGGHLRLDDRAVGGQHEIAVAAGLRCPPHNRGRAPQCRCGCRSSPRRPEFGSDRQRSPLIPVTCPLQFEAQPNRRRLTLSACRHLPGSRRNPR